MLEGFSLSKNFELDSMCRCCNNNSRFREFNWNVGDLHYHTINGDAYIMSGSLLWDGECWNVEGHSW